MSKLLHTLGRYWFLILIGIFVIWAIVDGSSDSSTLPPPAPAATQTQATNLPPPAAVSLPNGTVIKKIPSYFQGDATLEIDNGNDQDAVAKLICDSTSVFTVYITAGSDYTIKNISDGTCWLAYSTGSNWDSSTDSFTEDVSDSSFESTFDFTTEDYTVTINPVEGGTATTDDVNASQFNAY